MIPLRPSRPKRQSDEQAIRNRAAWPTELQEDARARDETGHGAKSNNKVSQRRYYCMRLVPAKNIELKEILFGG